MFRRKPKEPELPPEWLIVGLGNPGAEYRGTRHNVGFDFIDRLADVHKIKVQERKFNAVYGSGRAGEFSVALCKPMTYMNRSGQAIAPIMRHYGLKPERVLIVADDLDLPTGKLRLRPEGSPGGHNGHKSVAQSLGTQNYPRLKIGISKPGENRETIDHVLSRFDPEERKDIDDAIAYAIRYLDEVLTDVEAAMNVINAPR